MFKPRLRIPRRPVLGARPASCASAPRNLSSPLVAAAPAKQQQQQQRAIHASPARLRHHVAPLTEDGRFEKSGVPGLLSPEAFEAAYTNYQGWALDKLNSLTEGTVYEGKSTLELAIQSAREPQLAALFNYASMAHNNHFFFEGLSKTGGEESSEHMSPALQEQLETSFGSLETLQREFIYTADAMFGPGFVWLVRQNDTSSGGQARPFRLVTTYLAGSPYSGAHWRSQGTDMNTQGGVKDSSGGLVRDYLDRQNLANKRSGLHGSGLGEANMRRPPGGTDVIPVLCVNTWEHVWMWDWGVGGKVNYVANWWNIINWGRVHELAKIEPTRLMSANPGGFGPVKRTEEPKVDNPQ
ncbi:37S ribosomal protein S26, mitochondrial [Cytospora mali]|uniref:37S ribosomal protein S26, mitochondrial n=1 Tax=Cytospora mali TaxID=578113 RepID=A0A194VGG4_CYTMA|nr:37S ribosomal protein S26, mitochondrial [Valsa mali var. pyri (nom. inval.)]